MQRAWRWVAAGVAAVMLLGSGLLYTTDFGRKGVRYIERKYGWGEGGRRTRYEAAWQVAVAEYRQATRGRRAVPGEAEYPARAVLASYKEETVARLASGLADPSYDETWSAFAFDLLIALDREEARRVIRRNLGDSRLYWAPALADAAEAVFTVEERKQMLRDLPSFSRGQLLPALSSKLTRAELEQLVLDSPNGGWPYQLVESSPGWDVLVSLYPRLAAAGKTRVLQQAIAGKTPGLDPAALLQTEQDPAVRQYLLLATRDYPAYLQSVEQSGMFREAWLSWEQESQLAARYPDSFLARGIKAYEAVRGLPYFEMARRKEVPDWGRYRQFGNTQYDCDREIPGWTEFLAAYGKHEGADDAAYRLGRCLEIRGDYAGALRTLEGALTAGDGELSPDARNRIVWILDVELSETQLRGLPAGLPPEVEPMVLYTLALKQLRAGRYADGAALLEGFIRRYGGEPVQTAAWSDDRWAFWDRVNEQQRKALELARLAAAGSDPRAQYDLAAVIYHDEFLFYNHLWGGSRQYYMMDALLALEGDFAPVHTRWVAESNNYIQAIAVFERLASAPSPIREQAAYSRAMALSRLSTFGRDVALYKPISDIRAAARQALEQFVADYPKSDLAPDALLSLGYQTRESAYFDRLRKEYPKAPATQSIPPAADQASGSYSPSYLLPFRYMSLAEVPPEVAAKVGAVAGKGGTELVTVGDWTYIIQGATGMSRVELLLRDTPDAIEVRATDLTHTPGPGFAIARIPATTRTIH